MFSLACLFVAEFDYLVFSMLFFTLHLDERFFDHCNFAYHIALVIRTNRPAGLNRMKNVRNDGKLSHIENLDHYSTCLFNNNATFLIEPFLHVALCI